MPISRATWPVRIGSSLDWTKAWRPWARAAPGAAWSRFNPEGEANPARRGRNWNRTQVLPAADARGVAVLAHGLSDSPYSMRAVAEVFGGLDATAIALRLPGHGTIPGGLRDIRWRDARNAFALAARDASDRIGPDEFFAVAGYSYGAAIAVDYTLSALEGDGARVPDLLILISPAMRAPAVAAFASVQRCLSELPGLEKLGWTSVLPEYDPYKYNSFPIDAAAQIHGFTSQLQDRLTEARANGEMKSFPPLLIFLSVVDATIAPDTVVTGLLDHLEGTPAELVLFDVNRRAEVASLLTSSHESFLGPLMQNPQPWTLTLVTNDDDTDQVVARTRGAGETRFVETELPYSWPEGVYSLSHVALPFSPDDPLYGASAEDRSGLFRLGALEKRGERGVFGVPMDLLARLRYNPFFPYVESRIREAVYALPGAQQPRR